MIITILIFLILLPLKFKLTSTHSIILIQKENGIGWWLFPYSPFSGLRSSLWTGNLI